MAETDADRFLKASNETERHLQTVLQEDESISFKKLVREQGNRRVGPVRTHEYELKNLADLRNTIVHNPRRDGVAIAEPRRDIVERMGELKILIIDPPKAYPRFETNVTTARRDSPVRKIIQDMQQRNYSQAPILDDGNNVLGLLTANTIARWVGANIDQDRQGDEFLLTEETTVAHVQEYIEREDNYTFLTRSATFFDAAEVFRVKSDGYGPIDAVLITENGESFESLLGIVTVADLPAIQRKL